MSGHLCYSYSWLSGISCFRHWQKSMFYLFLSIICDADLKVKLLGTTVTIGLTLWRGTVQTCKWIGPICISNTLTNTFLFLIFKIITIFVDARRYLTMILSCVSLTMSISLCVQIGYLKVFVEISIQFLWLIFFYWVFYFVVESFYGFFLYSR